MKLLIVILFCYLATIHARLLKRIIGGTNAIHGAFPNIVRVYGVRRLSRSSGYTFHSGVIFNEKWIVVTGDCIMKIRTIVPMRYVKVIAGQWNHTDVEDSMQFRDIVLALKYSDYDLSRFGRSVDLGLLKLSSALRTDRFVAAIPFSTYPAYPSHIVIIIGWGSATYNYTGWDQLPDIVQVIESNVIPRNDCQYAIRLMVEDGQFYSEAQFNRFNFCTGSFTPNIRGTSFGDNGCPVMQVDIHGRFKVIGINSGGVATMDLDVHTRVSPFLPWIYSQIASYP